LFKNLFAAAAVAICTIGAAEVPGAKAAGNYCYTSQGNTVCIHSVRRHNTLGNARKLVVASVNGGQRSSIEVDCTTASPSNYKANLYGIACYEFN
tara:strand:- start:366 stop:650 length:285 start_codon:yes stop_codon:yes gene_type:complete